ncbi:MAG: hypothetical protein J2P21_13900 [Chloracidobacterium sp.]|nr:hypothetical protein [Chloracidobacterium sp.]
MVCSMEAELIEVAFAFPTRDARVAVEFEVVCYHNPQEVAQMAARQASEWAAVGVPDHYVEARIEVARFALN